MQPMRRPNTRAELERNFHLLHHKSENGMVQIMHHLRHTLEGLEKVRALPNGRVDFLSVDEMARLHANSLANMIRDRPEDAQESEEAGTSEPAQPAQPK
jgi:hypothetical protein